MGLIIVKIKQKCGICNKNDVFLQIFHLNLKYDTNVFHKKCSIARKGFANCDNLSAVTYQKSFGEAAVACAKFGIHAYAREQIFM